MDAELEPLADPVVPAPGPVRHALRVRRRRGADLDERPRRSDGALVAHDPRRRRRHASLCAAGPATCSACAGRSARPGRSTRRAVATSSSWPAESGWHRCDRRSTTRSRTASDFGSVCAARRRPHAGRPALTRELEHWRGRFDLDVDVTVDSAEAGWRGRVGVVTKLIPRAAFDPARRVAFVVRPGADDALHRRARCSSAACRRSASTSRWSATCRCGVGHCGHCQLGPVLICRDGPVFPLRRDGALMEVREL